MADVQNEYLYILNGMDPCGESDLIQNYIEEMKHYERTMMRVHTERILAEADRNIIGLLELILSDGSLQLDVAFCALISIIHCVQSVAGAEQYIIFAFFFVLGSCFPSLRPSFVIDDPDHPDHDTYKQSTVLQYLLQTYFANLNDKKCIKFKYNGQQSTHAISCALQQYTPLPSPIIWIICDHVQYPHQEFIDFVNDFLWHFPRTSSTRMECADWIQWCYTSDHKHGYLLPFVLGMQSDDVDDERLQYEAQRMTLIKLKTAEEMSWYLNHFFSYDFRCEVNPSVFIELLESTVSNPWELLRDAIVNHSVSILFHGSDQLVATQLLHHGETFFKQMIGIVQYTFEYLICKYFDSNDTELMRSVLYQVTNLYETVVQLPIECEAKKELINVLSQHKIALQLPPRKKRRIEN